jgi:hypothetical protein
MRQGGNRGQYLVVETITWDKVDIEVSVLGPQNCSWDIVDITRSIIIGTLSSSMQ